uniref:Uncharacterized protein n=1 Tax=Rhabditophanes sp. KR3021 TaxID=114890 RepID=A0AC35U7Z9_9BILA
MINAGIPSEKDVRILRQQSVANLEALKFKKVASKVERYEKVAAEQRTLRLMKRDNEEAKMMARRLKKETDAINKEISKAAEAKFKKNEKKLIEEKCFMTMETNAEPEKTIDIKSDNKVEQKNIMIMEEAVELGKTVTAKSDKRAEQPIQPLKSILVVSETDLKKLTQSGSEINQKKIRFDEKNLEENQKDVANKGKYVANNQLAVLREKKAIKDEYARDYAERLKENGCNERFQRHLEKKSSAYKYGIPLQGSKESYPPQLPSGNNKTNEKKSVVESKQMAAARKQPIDEDIIEVIDSGVNNSKRKSKLSRFFNFFRFKKAF